MTNEKLKELSQKYNKTPGQIVLNWIVDKGHIPIPMTQNKERMKENLGALEFKMVDEDIKSVELGIAYVKNMMLTDALTGMFNRHAYYEEINYYKNCDKTGDLDMLNIVKKY
mgnify:CR=1 FL=1